MPIFKTAYDTTVGKIFVVKPIQDALMKALMVGNTDKATLGLTNIGDLPACFVTGTGEEESTIPSFSHPMLVKDYNKKEYLVTDLRTFVGQSYKEDYLDSFKFEQALRGKPDYILAKTRARLNQMWLNPDYIQSLQTKGAFAGNVLAAWFSSSLTRAFALDYQDQTIITAATLYYFRLLFVDDVKLSGDALDIAVVHTIKTTKLPAKDVYSIYDNMGDISNIDDFCQQLGPLTGNVRLDNLRWPALWNLIQNSWFGINNKDILAASVEHPPTLIALVFLIMHERAYKNSGLYKIIDIVMKRGRADSFVKDMQEIIETEVLVAEEIRDDLWDNLEFAPED